jgi:hypothetical protein
MRGNKIKISILYPVGPIKKALIPIFIGFSIFLSLAEFESSLRYPDDFLNQKETCGELVSYYYDTKKIRGFTTWRLVVRSDQFGEEVYKVGGEYIQSVMKSDDMVLGSPICVRYIPMIVSFDHPFISQIVLDGVEILNNENVISEYMKPTSLLMKYFLMISIISVLFFLVKVEKIRK